MSAQGMDSNHRRIGQLPRLSDTQNSYCYRELKQFICAALT